MSYILLIIRMEDGTESRESLYAIPSEEKAHALSYFKKAIQFFFETKEGDQALYETQDTFCWLDVNEYVPLNLFAEFSIFPLAEKGSGPYALINYQMDDFVIEQVDSHEVLL